MMTLILSEQDKQELETSTIDDFLANHLDEMRDFLIPIKNDIDAITLYKQMQENPEEFAPVQQAIETAKTAVSVKIAPIHQEKLIP